MKNNLMYLKQLVQSQNLISKVRPKRKKDELREFFVDKLQRIFSKSPPLSGYKIEIESLLNELGMTQENLLHMALNCLSKKSRSNKEKKIITSYLYFMQDFYKLMKGVEDFEQENLLLNNLLTISESIYHKKCKKNSVLMRYGDKGKTAYIILDGS